MIFLKLLSPILEIKDKEFLRSAFGCYNLAHMFGVCCLFLFPAALTFIWYLLLGIIPLVIWIVASLLLLFFEIVGTLLYAVHCVKNDGVKSIFTSTGVCEEGVCTLGFYAFLLKLVSCVLMWITGVGFVSIFSCYGLGIVALTLAVQVVKE